MAGFREGAYARVWDIQPVAGKNATDIRISISSKSKETGEYKDDFAGFVRCYSGAHTKAANLQKKDRIKLLSTSVSNTYNKETKESKYYFSVFDFEPAEPFTSSGGGQAPDYPFEGEIGEPNNTGKTVDELPY